VSSGLEILCPQKHWKNMKTTCSILFDVLPRLLEIGCKIAKQDGRWWIFEHSGEAVISGRTFRDMCDKLDSVNITEHERRHEERQRKYMERSRNIDTLGW
jgi:hypothetical protein